MDEWIDEGVIGSGSAPKAAAGDGSKKRRRRGPEIDVPSMAEFVGRQRATRLEDRFEQAARAFAADRYIDARRILKPIEHEVPALAQVQELYGLTLYRLGKWREAADHLQEFVALTKGSVDQHPVLEDCYRALGRHDRVDALWTELRQASPAPELVTEGRIVAAGSLADRGDLSSGVALLAKGFRFPKKPVDHQMRRAYALADLYERSGDLPQARQLFARVARLDPDFVDVQDRLASLG